MSADLGILILRVVVGALMMGHGSQKLFGSFNGPGLDGFAGHLAKMGMRGEKFWALIAATSEFGGGLLFLLGFLNPLGQLAIIAVMLMAIAQVHWPKLWVTEGGMEYSLTLIAVSLAVALTGPGLYSMDVVLNTFLPMPGVLIIGLGAVVLGVVAAMASIDREEIHEIPEQEEEEDRRAA